MPLLSAVSTASWDVEITHGGPQGCLLSSLWHSQACAEAGPSSTPSWAHAMFSLSFLALLLAFLCAPFSAMLLSLAAPTQNWAGKAAAHENVLCFLHYTFYTGTFTGVLWPGYHCQRDENQPWSMCWVKSSRQGTTISLLLFLHLTELVYELMTIPCLKHPALIYHICDKN